MRAGHQGVADDRMATVTVAGRHVPLIAVVGAVWVLCIVLVLGNDPVSDEILHLDQAAAFADGDFELDDDITILPGYHAVIAVPLALTGSDSADIARLTTVGIAMVAVLLVHLASRTSSVLPLAANRTALQWALLPIAAPYAFLVYTDQLAALTVMAIWLLLRADRVTLAGFAAAAAVLVRQTNVGWAAVLVVVDLVARTGSVSAAARHLLRPEVLRRYWSFAIPVGIVVAILASTGTVAIGDTDVHTVGIYPENALFLVMLMGVFFWPVLLDRPVITRREQTVWAVAAGVGVIVFVVAWSPDHVFNSFGGTRFVRNWLLTNSIDRMPVRILLLLALVFGFVVLSRIPLRFPVASVLYPLSAVALLPQELVEQRYYIVPVTMLVILRRPGSDRAEQVLTWWWTAIMVGIAIGMFGLDRIVI